MPLDDRNLGAQFAIGQPFQVIGDEPAREGIRYGVGVENTWRNNAWVQVVLDVQEYGGVETLAASLRVGKQF